MKRYPVFLIITLFLISSFNTAQGQDPKAKMGLMESNSDAAVVGNVSFAFRPIRLDILSKKEVCEKNLLLSGTVLIKRKPLRSTTNGATNTLANPNSKLPVGTTKFGFPLIKVKDNVLLFGDDLTVPPIAPDSEFKIEMLITERDNRRCGGKNDVVDIHSSMQLNSLKLIVNTAQEKVWLQKSDGQKGALIGKMGETLTVRGGAKTTSDVLQGELTFKVFIKQYTKPLKPTLGTKPRKLKTRRANRSKYNMRK